MIRRTLSESEILAIFDTPEVSALIDDLGLIQVGKPYRTFGFQSRFRCKPNFCDIVKRGLDAKRRFRGNLCREISKRNQKYSRYVYATLTDYPQR